MRRIGKKVNLREPVDVDKIRIRRDIFLANAFVVEFPLEFQPDYIWQTFFEQEWRSSLHLWERKVTVLGNKLLLITTPTKIEEKIDWLKGVIESTNRQVEKFNEAQRAVEEKETAEALKKHENIIRDTLRMKLSNR